MRKSIVLSILAVACLAIILLQCSIPTVPAKFENPYTWIGTMHNEGLDAAFTNLRSHSKQLQGGADPVAIASEGIKKYFTDTYGKTMSDASLDAGRDFARGIASVPKVSVNKYVSQIRQLVRKGLGVDEFNDAVQDIEQQVPADSTTTLIACAVAKSSYEYWTLHGREWNSFFASLKVGQLNTLAHVDTAGEDSGGAYSRWWQGTVDADIFGAMAAVFPCVLTGPGWGNCVLATAVGMSVAYSIFYWPGWHP